MKEVLYFLMSSLVVSRGWNWSHVYFSRTQQTVKV